MCFLYGMFYVYLILNELNEKRLFKQALRVLGPWQ